MNLETFNNLALGEKVFLFVVLALILFVIVLYINKLIFGKKPRKSDGKSSTGIPKFHENVDTTFCSDWTVTAKGATFDEKLEAPKEKPEPKPKKECDLLFEFLKKVSINPTGAYAKTFLHKFVILLYEDNLYLTKEPFTKFDYEDLLCKAISPIGEMSLIKIAHGSLKKEVRKITGDRFYGWKIVPKTSKGREIVAIKLPLEYKDRLLDRARSLNKKK